MQGRQINLRRAACLAALPPVANESGRPVTASSRAPGWAARQYRYQFFTRVSRFSGSDRGIDINASAACAMIAQGDSEQHPRQWLWPTTLAAFAAILACRQGPVQVEVRCVGAHVKRRFDVDFPARPTHPVALGDR